MKRFVVNNIIIILATFLLVSANAAIYIADFSAKQRDNYRAVIYERIASAADEASNIINKGCDDASGFDYDDISSHDGLLNSYYGLAYIENGKNTIHIKTAEWERQYNLKSGAYSKLTQGQYNFILTENTIDNLEDNSFIIYINTQSEGTHILLNSAESVFSERYQFNFENQMIISADGVIVSDYNNALSRTLPDISYRFTTDGNNIFNAVLENEQKIFAVTAIQGGFKIGGYFSFADAERYISDRVTVLVIFTVATVIILFLGGALLLYAYLKHYYALFVFKREKPLYIVKTDNKGFIKKADRNFKINFDTNNIFMNIFDTGIPGSKVLNENMPLITCLKDTDGNEKYIIFFTINRINGYKFVGEDATALLDVYIKNLKEMRHNEFLKMFNKKQFEYDYKKQSELIRTESGLYIVLELRNVNKYRTMFGDDFFYEINQKYAQFFKDTFEEFGNVYYIGNQVFVLLVAGKEKCKIFTERIKNIMNRFNMPVHISKSLIKVECVAGIVALDDKTIKYNIEDIYEMAGFALEKAYELKKHYEFYDKKKEDYFISHTRKREIVRYISENQLIDIFFQPQYNISTKRIVGFEALSRIKGEYSNALTITEFIEIAERSGNMINIGDYVFEKAFEFVKKIEGMDVVVSLNVSPVQLLQAGFVNSFLEKMKQYDIKRGSVNLEITETFLMTSFDEIVIKLQMLKDNGINIHLDDFGVAYSSMLYLKKLPINTIKIDKEFVADIINNKYSRVICGKIIDITRELGLSSIAEGVETTEQLKILKELGCKVIQGFYISKALPSEEAYKLLNGGRFIKDV